MENSNEFIDEFAEMDSVSIKKEFSKVEILLLREKDDKAVELFHKV